MTNLTLKLSINMTVGFVDDQQTILDIYKNTFLAEGVSLQTWRFRDGDNDAIIAEIIESAPDVMLLDYHLSSHYKGRDLAADLYAAGYKGLLIGFSTDIYTAPIFAMANVKTFVHKNLVEPGESVQQIRMAYGQVPWNTTS